MRLRGLNSWRYFDCLWKSPVWMLLIFLSKAPLPSAWVMVNSDKGSQPSFGYKGPRKGKLSLCALIPLNLSCLFLFFHFNDSFLATPPLTAPMDQPPQRGTL